MAKRSFTKYISWTLEGKPMPDWNTPLIVAETAEEAEPKAERRALQWKADMTEAYGDEFQITSERVAPYGHWYFR